MPAKKQLPTPPTPPRRSSLEEQWPFVSKVLMFAFGAAGVFHETVVNNVDRPVLLAVFAGMLGLPYALGIDERRKEK